MKTIFTIQYDGVVEIELIAGNASDAMHHVLGWAAYLAFVKARVVLISENGTPWRYVSVSPVRPHHQV